MVNNKGKVIEKEIFDKSSDQISQKVKKSGFVDTRDADLSFTTTGSSSNYTLKHYVIHVI